MKTSALKPRLLHIMPAFGLFLIVQACGGGGDAQADPVPVDVVEGVWENAGSARDCTTNAVLSNFKGATVFHHGGTLTETNGQPTAARGPGFGVWAKSGEQYTTRLRFFTYDATTGAVSGSRRIVRTFTLSADKTTAIATATTELFDNAGTRISSGCAADTATKLY